MHQVYKYTCQEKSPALKASHAIHRHAMLLLPQAAYQNNMKLCQYHYISVLQVQINPLVTTLLYVLCFRISSLLY